MSVPDLPSRTQTEQWFLSEQLKKEELCLKKVSMYAAQVEDSQLKSLCDRFRELHEKNVRTLSGLNRVS